MSKKLNKEAFVQGHSGSSIIEIICIASAPAVLLLVAQLLSYSKNARKLNFDVLFQYLLFIVPLTAQMMGPLSPAAILTLVSAGALLLIVLNLQLLKRERSKVPLLAVR